MITTEQILIAIMLSKGEIYNDVKHLLTPNHFSEELPAKCYRIIIQAAEKGLVVTPITLFKESAGRISQQEFASVMHWHGSTTFNEPVQQLIAELIDRYVERGYESILTSLITQSRIGTSVDEVVASAIKQLTDLVDNSFVEDEVIGMQSLMSEEREAYYRRQELALTGKISGKTTGIEALDRYTGGIQNELFLIAGRPGSGKTALALFIGASINEPGIYFNMEMGKTQLSQRFILQNSNEEIDSSALRDGKLSPSELMAFEKTIGKVERFPFQIYDKGGCGVHEAIRVIKREHRKGKCKWVIIDYLQLMTLEGYKGGNREQEVAKISKMFKALQKELTIPIIVLAQLNRDCEKRPDKMPQTSDLRESGSLEQDADTIMLVYRPGYYGLNDPDTDQPFTNEIFGVFGKHRMGATGSVGFRHNKTMSGFFGMNDSQPLPPIQTSALNSIRSFSEVDKESDPF